jgi:hypothetical protein
MQFSLKNINIVNGILYGFKVLTTMLLNIPLFWGTTLCLWLTDFRRTFKESQCIYFRVKQPNLCTRTAFHEYEGIKMA